MCDMQDTSQLFGMSSKVIKLYHSVPQSNAATAECLLLIIQHSLKLTEFSFYGA